MLLLLALWFACWCFWAVEVYFVFVFGLVVVVVVVSCQSLGWRALMVFGVMVGFGVLRVLGAGYWVKCLVRGSKGRRH